MVFKTYEWVTLNNLEQAIQTKSKVDWLIIATIISAFIGPGLSYGKVYLYHITLVLCFVWMLKKIFLKEVTGVSDFAKRFFRYDWPIIAYFGVLTVSLIWTPSLNMGIKYLSQLFLSLSVYFLFYFLNDEEFKIVLKLILAFFLLEIFICFGEHLKFWRYPISSYSSMANLFLRETNPDSYASVPTGFRFNPNNLGALIAIIGPFFYFSNLLKLNILFLPIFYIGTAANARAALVASLIGGFFAIWFMGKNQLLKLGKILVIFLLIFLLMWKLFLHGYLEMRKIYSIPREMIAFFIPDEIPDDDSVRIRRNLFITGFKNLAESNYFGTGVSSTLVQANKANLHNYWLEVLVEGGLLGGCLFYFWYIKKLYSLMMRLFRRKPNENFEEFQLSIRKSTMISLIIIPFAIISCSTAVYYSPFWLLLGIAGYLVRKDSEVTGDQEVLSSLELKK